MRPTWTLGIGLVKAIFWNYCRQSKAEWFKEWSPELVSIVPSKSAEVLGNWSL